MTRCINVQVRWGATAALVLALSAYTQADDYWVNASGGSDMNTGTSPETAWQTLTHALEVVPSPPAPLTHTIHVAPGTYGPGESLPLFVGSRIRIVGDLGSAVTIVDGGGATASLFVSGAADLFGDHHSSVGSETWIQGMSLRNAAVGVDLYAEDGYDVGPTLRDLVITGMSSTGVLAQADFFGFEDPRSTVTPVLESVRVTSNGVGVLVTNSGDSDSRATLTATDCEFSDSHGVGIVVRSYSGWFASANLSRCRIVHNGSSGISAEGGWAFIGLSDSLVAYNTEDGLEVAADGLGGAWVVRSTLSANVDAGIAIAGGDGSASLRLESSILYGNGDDVVDPRAFLEDVSYCNVGDGDFAGVGGNVSADPSFLGPGTGDFRLRYGSPCVDTGHPSTPAGVLDLAGFPRSADGDLDTLERADMGALELAPLSLRGEPLLGTTIALELWGPHAGLAAVHWVRGEPLASPLATPFGELDLDPVSMRLFKVVSTAQGPPVSWPIAIPDDPALAGASFTFQALMTSDAPTTSRAYSNALTLTIRPANP